LVIFCICIINTVDETEEFSFDVYVNLSGMAQRFNPREFQIQYKKFQYQLKKFFQHAWPIKWSIFKSPKVLIEVIHQSPYFLQLTVGVGVVGCLVSLIFVLFGSYAESTREVGLPGGVVREAVFGEMENFLPVLAMNTEAERKVSHLLFHPLYEVKMPNLLTSQEKPTIVPILLENPPQWARPEGVSQNPYNRLRFILKDSLKWSDGSTLTVKDINYTFSLLKSGIMANVFAKVTFEKVDEKTFDLISEVANPSLLYNSNISPVSEAYFGSLNIERLQSDPRKTSPTISSGYFMMKMENIANPDNPQSTISNPFKDEKTQRIRSVILQKNPNKNTEFDTLVDTYVIKKYDSLNTTNDVNSLSAGTADSKIDIFSRNLATVNLQEQTPQNVRNTLNLTQKIIPNNTYITAFANAGRSTSNEFGYLKNQSLRQYIMCSLARFEEGETLKNTYTEIPDEKKLVPVQLGLSSQFNCPADLSKILDENYNIVHNDPRSVKKLFLINPSTKKSISDIRLNVIWGIADQTLKEDLRKYFLNEVGVPFENLVEGADIQPKLSAGEYDLIFLPLTVATPDPYAIYGEEGLNLTRVSSSNKSSILQAKPETLLKRYSNSNFNDAEAKQLLAKFFSEEFVSLQLWQTKTEINYNPSVGGLLKSLPDHVTSTSDLYNLLESWYVKTGREWKWVTTPREKSLKSAIN